MVDENDETPRDGAPPASNPQEPPPPQAVETAPLDADRAVFDPYDEGEHVESAPPLANPQTSEGIFDPYGHAASAADPASR